MVSGTIHILSISGSHLTLVAMVVFASSLWLIRRLPARWNLWLGRWILPVQLGAVMTIVPVSFYALLAGGQIATIRSLIMILVYLGALWLRRPHNAMNALALAALIITLTNPLAVFDISFQLSYGAVLLMILSVQERDVDKSSRLRGGQWSELIYSKLKVLFLLTAFAGLGTGPLVAHHFNYFSWVGLISNFIITPYVGILVVPGGLLSAAGVILADSSIYPLSGLNPFLNVV